MKTPVDSLGREIKVGDIVTYPVRYSSSMYIRFAKILSIKYVKSEGYDEIYPILNVLTVNKRYNTENSVRGKKTRIQCYKRTTVITDVQSDDIIFKFLKEYEV
jgi:hypothetical protein